jgi:hypothetical protein
VCGPELLRRVGGAPSAAGLDAVDDRDPHQRQTSMKTLQQLSCRRGWDRRRRAVGVRRRVEDVVNLYGKRWPFQRVRGRDSCAHQARMRNWQHALATGSFVSSWGWRVVASSTRAAEPAAQAAPSLRSRPTAGFRGLQFRGGSIWRTACRVRMTAGCSRSAVTTFDRSG